MNDRMLTTREVAQQLHVSQRWVRERCASGEIRAVRLSGTGPWRIFPDGLAKVLKEKKPKPEKVDRTPALRSMARQGLLPTGRERPETLLRKYGPTVVDALGLTGDGHPKKGRRRASGNVDRAEPAGQ